MAEQLAQITEEQRAEYIRLRDEFHKGRDYTKARIQEHQVVLDSRQRQIKVLEGLLRDSRPQIEGCDDIMLCTRCDIYSMRFIGRSPDQDRTMQYKCVICGYEGHCT